MRAKNNRMNRRDSLRSVVGGAAWLIEQSLSGCAPAPLVKKEISAPAALTAPPKEPERGVVSAIQAEIKKEKEIPHDIAVAIKKLESRFGLENDQYALIVDPASQALFLIKNGIILKEYPVSTGKNGVGNKMRSEQTPYGTHRIKEKIGNGAAVGTILVGEGDKNGTISSIITDPIDTSFDYVTTRLVRLDGQEQGINKGGDHDSHHRDIYIHGTPEEGLLGQPASHGCIRMKNNDIIELFNLAPSGTLVEILKKEYTRNKIN